MNWYKTAQNFGEFSNEDEEPDIIQEVFDEVFPPPVQQFTESLKTYYEVNGVTVILSIAGAGMPQLCFEDESFPEKFPSVDIWTYQNWNANTGTYHHQDPQNVQGPTFDILPEGKWTVLDYLNRNLPFKLSREERSERLPFKGKIDSYKKLDKDTRSFLKYQIYLTESSIGLSRTHPIFRDKIRSLFPQRAILDDFLKSTGNKRGKYELFTEDQFNTLLEYIENAENSGELNLSTIQPL